MPHIVLRDYQAEMIDRLRESFRSHNSSLLVAPTGAGKTALTVHMMATAADRGKSSMFVVHRDTLLSQTSRALWNQGVQHGIIASGRQMSRQPIQVASVQTLVRRLDRVQAPDLLIIDEAHRAAAQTYIKVIQHFQGKRSLKVAGLTATPQRTDGQGLGDVFDDLVLGPTEATLIKQGYLCEYTIIAPASNSSPDMSGVKKRGGDYAAEDIERAVDKPTITGDAVSAYLKHARGKRCVVFCATLKHAQHVRDAYLAAGVPAEYMDGNTPSHEREAILGRVATGETLVLVNVELVIEGCDVPSIEVVQWLRPTASIIIWRQGNGRGFRPFDGKRRLIILDQVANWTRHGLPDDEIAWSLEGQPKRKRGESEPEVKAKQCGKCYAVFKAGPTHCPSCGEPLAGEGRKIEIVEGDLIEIDIETMRREQKREQGAARTLTDLVALGLRRGQNKPAEWACMVFAARQNGRKPTPAEFKQAREALTVLQGVWGFKSAEVQSA